MGRGPKKKAILASEAPAIRGGGPPSQSSSLRSPTVTVSQHNPVPEDMREAVSELLSDEISSYSYARLSSDDITLLDADAGYLDGDIPAEERKVLSVPIGDKTLDIYFERDRVDGLGENFILGADDIDVIEESMESLKTKALFALLEEQKTKFSSDYSQEVREEAEAAVDMLSGMSGLSSEEVRKDLKAVIGSYSDGIRNDVAAEKLDNIQNKLQNGGYDTAESQWGAGVAKEIAESYIDLSDEAFSRHVRENLREELRERVLYAARNTGRDIDSFDPDELASWEEEEIGDMDEEYRENWEQEVVENFYDSLGNEENIEILKDVFAEDLYASESEVADILEWEGPEDSDGSPFVEYAKERSSTLKKIKPYDLEGLLQDMGVSSQGNIESIPDGGVVIISGTKAQAYQM